MLAACAPSSCRGSRSRCSPAWRPAPPPAWRSARGRRRAGASIRWGAAYWIPAPGGSGWATQRGRRRAPRGAEPPLVGRLLDTRTGRFVTADAMVRAAATSRFVLLGEKHDNPDHHQIQAAVLRAILATGRRPIVAFEMFTPDDAPALARFLGTAPRDAAGLGAAVDWKNNGWPDWAYYQPIAQAALDAGVPIVAANLTQATARALARGQRAALPANLAEHYALDQPPSAALQAALTTEIREAHCGHFPADRVDGMVLAQRTRDSALAESLLAGADGGGLIAGPAPSATIAACRPTCAGACRMPPSPRWPRSRYARSGRSRRTTRGRTAERSRSTGSGSRRAWTTRTPAPGSGSRPLRRAADGSASRRRRAWGWWRGGRQLRQARKLR